jgi:transposase-like protein
MATKNRDGEREAYWQGVLRRHAQSGQSVRAFCRCEQLSEPSFYAWRRTIEERDAAGRQPMQPAFLPVAIRETPAAESAIVIELRGGRLLKLPASTSPTRMAELVHALEATETPS